MVEETGPAEIPIARIGSLDDITNLAAKAYWVAGHEVSKNGSGPSVAYVILRNNLREEVRVTFTDVQPYKGQHLLIDQIYIVVTGEMPEGAGEMPKWARKKYMR